MRFRKRVGGGSALFCAPLSLQEVLRCEKAIDEISSLVVVLVCRSGMYARNHPYEGELARAYLGLSITLKVMVKAVPAVPLASERV